MKAGIAKIVLFGFAILAVAVILLRWKASDREKALDELEKVYQVTFNQFNDEVHLIASSPKIRDLNQLADLIERAEKLRDGSPLNPCVLDLTGNPSVKTLLGAARLQNLRSIIAVDCPQLADARGVSGLPNLSEIILSHNGALTDVSSIRDLSALVTIDLTNSPGLVTTDLENLPSLENLYLSGCRNLGELDVSLHPGLKQLYLDSCMQVTAIKGLDQLVNLTDLDVSNCQKLKNLGGLEKLVELIVLDLRNVELPDFSVIATLPNLEVLRLAGQGSIASLEPFTPLKKLRELHLESCPNLVSLKGIPPTLSEYLGIVRCPALTSLSGIEAAAKLQHAELNGCTALEDITALKPLSELVRLSLMQCRKIKDISQLSHNRNLAIVRLGESGVVAADIEALQQVLVETVFDFSVPE